VTVLFLSVLPARLKLKVPLRLSFASSDFIFLFSAVPSLEVLSTPLRPSNSSRDYSPFDYSKKRKNDSWRNKNHFNNYNNHNGESADALTSFNYSSPTISPSTSTSKSSYVSPVNNGRYFYQAEAFVIWIFFFIMFSFLLGRKR
jgi:hypothetical protein